jgi:peptidoglycan/LPS O-acetylase OafA/YrhL
MPPPRTTKVRLLVLPIAGALAAASVAWLIWGLTTPGDYFGGGNPALWFTLVAAALCGGYGATRIHSRWGAAALLFAAALCILFWVAAPDGWWASPPPPMQQAQ